MRNQFKCLFAALLLCCVASPVLAQFSGSGSGTADDPYRIYNAVQLNQVRNFVGIEDVYFSLEADIDMTDWIAENNPVQGWQPIEGGNFGTVLDFNGNGHIIKNLWINRPDTDYIGLFGRLSAEGSIYDLQLENADYVGGDCIGGIIGSASGMNLESCDFDGKIAGNNKIGGLLGWTYDFEGIRIVDCVSRCVITGGDEIGGIVGNASYSYEFDYSYRSLNVSNCLSYCQIEGNADIGGIIGNAYLWSNYGNIHMSECYSFSVIKGKNNLGGIVGCYVYNNQGTGVYDCYSNGNIVGYSNIGSIAGNFKGYNLGSVGINNCYSNYNVIEGDNNVGGVIGIVDIDNDNIENNVAINKNISAISELYRIGRNVNCFLGKNLAWTLTPMFLDGVRLSIPEDSEENGINTGLSTLKLQATYEGLGWDFNDIWKIEETESFPYFQWQTAPPYFSQTLKKGDTHLSGQCTEQGTVTVRVGDKRYTVQSAGNAWSVDLEEPLDAGDMVGIWVQAEEKMPSYVVCVTAGLSGSGTETDPYLITSAEDLQAISDITDDNSHYRLTADIDLTEYIAENGWTPVTIRGHFDGQGHTVSGLQCEAETAGLFHTLYAGGEIKNLKVIIATDGTLKGSLLAGGLVGNNKGTITNCSVSGNVEGATIAGCIAGISSGSISECYTKGNVSSSAGEAHMGGIVGENSAGGKVSDCYSDVVTDASGSNAYVGGIVGYNYGKVEHCYATGDVTGYTVAGVCGYNSGAAAELKGCVAANSNLSGSKQALRVVGGFSSEATAPGLIDNYAVSDMVVSVNGVPQTIYDDPLNGTAMPESELMKQSTYEALGWNFTDVWKIDEGTSFPYLPEFDIPVSMVTLDMNEAELMRGETLQLSATVSPDDARNPKVLWTSDNDKIATVDADGVVTAIAVGEATITATAADCSGMSATCKIKVTPKLVEQISLSENELSVENGSSVQLTVTVLPQDADDISVIWTSNNTMVATVDATGRVSAVGVGTAVITATTNDGSNLTADCMVTVAPKKVVFISLDKTNLTLRIDESALLTATVLPEDAGDRSVTWTSSDENVATVNNNGVVTAIGVGEADITAAANDGSGVAATCYVTVSPIIAESITLDKKELVMIKGKTDRLTPVILPNNVTDKSVTWTSSDDNVVTVDGDGNIEAIGEGIAEVTVTTNDGSNLSATCKVTVINPDGGIYGVSADGISVFVKDDRIFVAGKDDDEIVTVHTLEGRLVYRGTDNAIDVYSNMYYLVTVRGTTYKVFIP